MVLNGVKVDDVLCLPYSCAIIYRSLYCIFTMPLILKNYSPVCYGLVETMMSNSSWPLQPVTHCYMLCILY